VLFFLEVLMQRLAVTSFGVALLTLSIRFLLHGLLVSGCSAEWERPLDVSQWVWVSILCGAAVGVGSVAALRFGVRRPRRLRSVGRAVEVVRFV
jgi:hypothetical protein